MYDFLSIFRIFKFKKVSGNYITGLGITQIFISLFIVSYFLLKTAPLLIQKAWAGFVNIFNLKNFEMF